MIRTTLGAIAAAEESIKAVAALRLPVKAAYAVSKLLAIVGPELEHWHKQRIAWVHEFGSPTADGNTAVDPAAMPQFIARMNDLAAVAVELQATPVALDLLGDVEMTARDLGALTGAGLIVDPEQPKGVSDGERQLQSTGARR